MVLEFSYICWAFAKITGKADFTGWVVVRSRHGGICSTTPPLPAGVNRRKLAKALADLLPQDNDEIIETRFFVNRGYPNPK